MNHLANPTRFMRLAEGLLPWTVSAALICLGSGLYYGLIVSPADYQQGESVRIMYVHVPAAWMSLFVYALMAAAAVSFLVWKHPLADIAARSAAPLGAGFTAIALLTGALWGRPMWGVWWVWDARLTSELILLFLYIGYIALANAFDEPVRGARAAAILALVGVVNLPIIKFSVDWWNTLHQPASLIRAGAPAIHSSMLIPLLLMAAGFMFYFLATMTVGMRGLLLARRVRMMRRAGPRVGANVGANVGPSAGARVGARVSGQALRGSRDGGP